MQTAQGYVEAIDAGVLTCRFFYGNEQEGIATLPMAMLSDFEAAHVREGSLVEADIDDTLLVTRLILMQVPMWTQADIDNAKAEAARLHAALKFH